MTATLDQEIDDLRQANAQLQRRLEEALAERDEALEQQTATADLLKESLEHQTATNDVLKVISRSAFDLHAVLETLAQTAARLFAAEMVFVYRREGEVYRLAANYGFPPEYEAFVRAMGGFDPRRRQSVSARAARLGRAVHIHDVAVEPGYSSEGILLGKVRTALALPLLREGEAIGVLGLARQRVEPVTDRQIELVRTFADQAVIAIENARLLTETREALERQTATAEVLQVINAFPGDLSPVFDAMLEKAMRLCGAAFGELRTYDGERFNLAAVHGVPNTYVDYYRAHNTGIYGSGTGPTQLLAGKPLVHIPDLTATEPYQQGDPDRRALVDLGGARSYLMVPLLRDRTVLGYIMIYRQETGSFSDKQVAPCDGAKEFAVIGQQGPVRRFAKGVRLFQYRIEHRGEIAGRAIDDLQYLGRRGLLLQGLARLGQEPRILYRDHCLGREILQQRNLSVGKWPHLQARRGNQPQE